MSNLLASDISQFIAEIKSTCVTAPLWLFSMETYNQLRYWHHIGKAHLAEPHYKLRKCHLKRLAQRRQAAKKRYLGGVR